MCSFPQELGSERVRAGAGCTQEGPLGTSLDAQTTFPASAPQEYLLETHVSNVLNKAALHEHRIPAITNPVRCTY